MAVYNETFIGVRIINPSLTNQALLTEVDQQSQRFMGQTQVITELCSMCRSQTGHGLEFHNDVIHHNVHLILLVKHVLLVVHRYLLFALVINAAVKQLKVQCLLVYRLKQSSIKFRVYCHGCTYDFVNLVRVLGQIQHKLMSINGLINGNYMFFLTFNINYHLIDH